MSFRSQIHPTSWVLLITVFLLFSSTIGFSQDPVFNQPLSLSAENTIHQVLIEIGNKTGYYFTYNSKLFDDSKVVSIHATEEPIIQILNQILPDSTLDYRVIGKQVIIYREQIVHNEPNTSEKRNIISFLEITGNVTDLNSKKPIPFATIALQGKSVGTVTNIEGDFLLKIHPDNLEDTVIVSSLGYKIVQLPVSNFIPGPQSIQLAVDYITIQEVIIRKTDPLVLLKKSLDKVRENYPNNPSVTTNFYRETIAKSKEFVAVSEGIIEVYKPGYNKPGIDQVHILKSRKLIDQTQYDTLNMKLKAGLSSSLMLDIVKHYPDFLMDDFFPLYNYKMNDIVTIDGESAYVIEFKEKEASKTPMYEGQIFIDMNSHAIKGAEFRLNKKELKTAHRFLVLKKPRRLQVKPIGASYVVYYTSFEGKHYPYYVKGEIKFRIRLRRRNLIGAEYKVVNEMVITDINTKEPERFKADEKARTRDFFTEQIGTYDNEFWEQYNYVIATQSLFKAFGKKE